MSVQMFVQIFFFTIANGYNFKVMERLSTQSVGYLMTKCEFGSQKLGISTFP